MAAANDWRCARCLRKPPYVRRRGPSAICQRCHADLAARGQRWCRACNAAYPIEDFPLVCTDERGVARRRAVCWRCFSRQRAGNERYLEQQRRLSRAYYARNRETIAERRRASRAARTPEQRDRDRIARKIWRYRAHRRQQSVL